MPPSLKLGDCVVLPDGRIGRVRDVLGKAYRIRVRRKTSPTHQFVNLAAKDLQRIACPKGWMSPDGFRKYLRVTLAKMRQRTTKRSHRKSR